MDEEATTAADFSSSTVFSLTSLVPFSTVFCVEELVKEEEEEDDSGVGGTDVFNSFSSTSSLLSSSST